MENEYQWDMPVVNLSTRIRKAGFGCWTDSQWVPNHVRIQNMVPPCPPPRAREPAVFAV